VFACLVAVVWPVVFGVRPKRGILATGLLALWILQLQLEGYRWQMLPLYAIALGLAVGDVIFIDRRLKWTNRVSRGVFGSGGVLLAAALPLILPVPLMPAPTGSMPVGTVSFELIDRERDEIYGDVPGGPRTFMVQVWYPAADTVGLTTDVWTDNFDVVAPAAARRLGLPSWFLSHTRYTHANSYRTAPLGGGTFPVIIYSHGWSGFRSVAVTQMEALASNGYVVIAPDHTYGAVATMLANGEVIERDPDALPPVGAVGEDARLRAAATLIDTFAGDVVTVLDELEKGGVGRFADFADSLDLDRIGVFGHSAGGGAAIQVCLTDDRCDAVLAFDPWVEPLPDRVLRESMARPALYMRSDDWRGSRNDAMLRGVAGRASAVTYWLGVEGASHNDFTIAPLLTSFGSRFGFTGSLPAGRVLSIIDNYLVGFFDLFLLETGSAALDSVAFPSVSLERIQPRS
jgi:pimeloyl-ACP methyl ester carboxylesterase